jgi:hypothetical protein
MVAILGANSVSDEYEVSNSLRFNDDDSPNLQRTFSSGNQTDWTWSAWVKRGNISNNNQVIFGRQNVADGSNIGKILFTSSDELKLNNKVGASTGFEAVTFAKFRDPSAWYHIWISFDGNQSTHNDRASLYVNGVQFSWNSSSSLSAGNGHINLNLPHAVGFRAGDGGEQYDGYIAEMHFIDGNNSLNHTDFGEFDNNGVWIPKQYTGSYGTNGFFLEFKQTGTSANSSGIGADTSGNDNHFTPTNLAATDITEDTCTNNFATLNSLNFADGGYTMSEGNVKINTNDATRCAGPSTIGVSSGKWYWEIKHTSGASNSQIGIAAEPDELTRTKTSVGESSTSWSYVAPTGKIRNTSNDLHSGSTLADGDIMNIALDLDNNYIYFGKNNTYQNSGDPTSGSSGTGGFAVTAGLTYFYLGGDRTTGGGATQEVNFGNPSFSISSGNTDGKYGNFEYAPPSGYYALCTKRLAEFG